MFCIVYLGFFSRSDDTFLFGDVRRINVRVCPCVSVANPSFFFLRILRLFAAKPKFYLRDLRDLRDLRALRGENKFIFQAHPEYTPPSATPLLSLQPPISWYYSTYNPLSLTSAL